MNLLKIAELLLYTPESRWEIVSILDHPVIFTGYKYSYKSRDYILYFDEDFGYWIIRVNVLYTNYGVQFTGASLSLGNIFCSEESAPLENAEYIITHYTGDLE